jgi:hypothetical protein
MDPELDRTLCRRYPEIFADRHGLVFQSAMGRGFEVGSGWYALIDLLCAALQREHDRNGAPQIVAIQVKEKFGGLRFRVREASRCQRAMIACAEQLSMRLCEICGKPGRCGVYPGIGRTTRCQRHGA